MANMQESILMVTLFKYILSNCFLYMHGIPAPCLRKVMHSMESRAASHGPFVLRTLKF